MAKKKKHHKKKNEFTKDKTFIDNLEKRLESQYQEIVEDIEDIQHQIYKADKKKREKQKKKMKKGKISFYEPKDKKIRVWASERISSDNFFSRIKNILEELKPVAIIISKLVATLIASILSLDIVKANITQQNLSRMGTLYKLCMAVK